MQAPLRAGPYWFLAALGRGGMADIFLVAARTSIGVDRVLVLKRPRLDFLDDQGLVSMFLDEGRLATRLEHANVVRTQEVAIYDGRPYMAMEFVDGVSLHRLLHEVQEGRVEVGEATWLSLMSDVLRALDYAHNLEDFDGSPLGIVHRDVSPGNVLISYNGAVKLCDFGVAKTALQSAKTEAGTVKGKAGHLAPECLKGEAVDWRADLYSVGVLLFKCLTGTSPWRSPMKLEERESPRRLSTLIPDAAPALDRIIARALAADPEQRYSSAREMQEAIEEYLGAGNRTGRRKLVAQLKERMASERAALRELIRERIAELDNVAEEETQTLPRLMPKESVPPEPTSISLRPSPTGEPSSGASRLAPYLVAALALGGLAAGVAAWRSDGGVSHVTTASPSSDDLPSFASSGSSGEPTTAVEATPTKVEVYVVVAPRDARITIDGELQQSNPVSLMVTPDDEEHVLEASAPGYRTQRRTIRFAEGADINMRLERTGSSPGQAVDGSPSEPEAGDDARPSDPWPNRGE